KKLIIVGGGVTGLTAAYYVKKHMEQSGLSHEVKVIEASDRLGGKISTVHQDGFVLERGADSFLERKKPAITLVKELGLTDELVRSEENTSELQSRFDLVCRILLEKKKTAQQA